MAAGQIQALSAGWGLLLRVEDDGSGFLISPYCTATLFLPLVNHHLVRLEMGDTKQWLAISFRLHLIKGVCVNFPRALSKGLQFLLDDI